MCYLNILFPEITVNAEFYFKALVETLYFLVIQLMKFHSKIKNWYSLRKIIFYLIIVYSAKSFILLRFQAYSLYGHSS